MDRLLQDLRYGFRTLAKRPGFTLLAVVTLALGIGANTAIFTVVEAALLRSLPYKEPSRIVHLWETRAQREFSQMEASYPNYLDWREQNQVFESMAGYNRRSFALTGRDAPEQILAGRVSADFFSVLGVEAAIGRTFRAEEDRPGGERLVVISHGLWQRRFGGDADLVGQTIPLGGNSYTVIGILPASFQFAPVGGAEVWVPLDPSSAEMASRSRHWFYPVARLKPGVSLESAQTEMSAIAGRLEQEYPDFNTGGGVRVVPLHDQVVGDVRPALLVLLATVGFVLLIACANVANLSLAQAAARQKEIALRLALGASRARLVRQLLTESLLLALAGGGLGVLWAVWGIELLIAGIPEAQLAFLPFLRGVSINREVLGLTCAISLATGIVCGLVPALQASKPDLNDALKEGGRTSSGTASPRLRNLLVVSEIALALVLLVGAGLTIKSTLRLLEVDVGFDPSRLLTMQVSLPPARYSQPGEAARFQSQLLDRIESLPGVKGAAVTSKLPLIGGTTSSFVVEGRPTPAAGEFPEANVRSVSAGYFRVLGAQLVRGRHFTAQDNQDSAKVIIINQTLGERLFAGQDPVGQRLVFGSAANSERWEIVGVVADLKESNLDAKTTPVIYYPYPQSPAPNMSIVVRAASDPHSFLPAVEGEIRALDRDLPVYSVATMEQLISNLPSTFARRYPALLIAVFAAAALLLAVVGIYGVVAYSVSERTKEMGIRIALGAQSSDIIRLVISQGLRLTLFGVAAGLAGAFLLTRFLSSLLFDVSAIDPATFFSIPLLLAVVTLAACYVPARRATKIEPMVALRDE